MKKKKSNKKKREISEAELLETIETISRKLAYKFRFGYHEIEDMKQQISIFAIEGLANYDHKRPLENFLWTHVRNRLYNYKRDNYQRPGKPCLACPLYRPNDHRFPSLCEKYTDTTECKEYSTWEKRNNSKKNLMYLNTIEELRDMVSEQKNNEIDSLLNQEILDRIEAELSGEERKTYLKIKNGVKITKLESKKLIENIRELFND